MALIVLLLLTTSAPLAIGQLVLGFCPIPHTYERDLNYEKYAGTWYVLAQSENHPLGAQDCQKYSYTAKKDGMSVQFDTSTENGNHQEYKNATLKHKLKYPGDMNYQFNNFPRWYDFHVLRVQYDKVAVEWLCMYGAITYRASITVLHREPLEQKDLGTTLEELHLKDIIPEKYISGMRLVGHSNCGN